MSVAPQDMHRRTTARQLCEAIAECHQQDAMQILAAALEDFETSGPPVSLYDPRDDARLWAECASPRELEVYGTEILRRLDKPAFSISARKRLLVSLWESLSDADRQSFLSKVDPTLHFVRRAV